MFEKNEKLGKKLYITGKGRCNITNAADMEQLFANVVTNHKFLYSAFYGFDNMQTISFFEELGITPKEKQGYIYPYSEQAVAFVEVLEMEIKKRNVQVCYEKVVQIQQKKNWRMRLRRLRK